MTAATLKKYRTYLTDEAGKPIMVQLDLRNKVVRNFYEKMMEDFEDTLTVIERQKEEGIPWAEAKALLEANWMSQ